MQTLIGPARAALALAVAVALSTGLAPTATAAEPLPSAWTPTVPLTTPRIALTSAATLADGSGIVIGGGTTAAERFDPATGAWTTLAPIPVTRFGAVATLLSDGRVLVTGGSDGLIATTSAYLYDPASDGWTTAAPMNVERAGHTATLLRDGTVLVTGGYVATSTPTASAERYDPAADTWTPVAPMSAARASHAATLMPDGTVAVLGGDGAAGTYPALVERFDPASGSWAALPPLASGRSNASAISLPDGTLLAIGGTGAGAAASGIQRLAPGSVGWVPVPGAPRAARPKVALLKGGALLVVDGTSAIVADPATGRAAEAGRLAAARVAAPAIVLGDGSVLVVGGGTPSDQGNAERFDPRAYAQVAPADFGEQTTGRRGAVVQVPVQTAGDVPLIVRSTTVAGPDARDFAVVTDGCAGEVVPKRATCFVGIRFTPGGEGARNATLVLRANELAGGSVEVPLSGVGVPAPPAPAPPAPAPPSGGSARRAAATPTLHCSARTGRRVRCTGVPRSLGSGKVRLSRNGIVHATGTLKGGRLTLTVRRRLFDRRYTLVVGGRRTVKVVLD